VLVLRVIGLAAILLVGGLLIAWAVTKDRKYARIAYRVAQVVVGLVIAFALLYVFERVLLL
jgi:hypothetical protein